MPLGLTIFFDHYEGSQNVSYGAYILGVLNLKSQALLSPTTKMCLAIVPYALDVEITRELVLGELREMQDNGLSVKYEDGSVTQFHVRIAFACGDSKDLNGFIGLGNFNSKFGCRSCWVDTNNLKNYHVNFPSKTSFEIQNIYKEATLLENVNEPGEAKKLLTSSSLPLKPLSFFFCHLIGDWCKLSPRDILHAELLGLLKKEMSHLFKDVLEVEAVEKIIAILQQSVFPKGETNLAKKLDKISSFNGRELKSLVYVLPFAFINLFHPETPWLKCFLKHCYYFRLLTRIKFPKTDKLMIEHLISEHHFEYSQLYPSKT